MRISGDLFGMDEADGFAGAVLGLMGEDDNAGIMRIPYELAQEGKDDLVRMIESQNFPATPLSARWSDYKSRNALDPRILIATGATLENIQVVHLGAGSYGIVIIDPDLEEKAKFNEWGTSTIPARHTWALEAEKLWEKLPRKVKQYKMRASTISRSKW